MDGPLFIALMVFLSAGTAIGGVFAYSESRRGARQWRDRVEAIPRTQQDEGREDKGVSGLAYFRDQFLGTLERLGQMTESKKTPQKSAMRSSLVTAGFRVPHAPSVFVGAKLFFAVVLPAVLFVVPIPALDGLASTQQLAVYLVVGAIGVYLPDLWLRVMTSRRQSRITDGFPDALDLLVVCVEAGLGLDAAVHRTGTELAMAHPELADELNVLTLELRAGLPRDQALDNLSNRVDLDPVKSLTSLLIQTDRFGTSVGQALRVYSDAMRKERALRAEEKAAKLPVKMLFPLILFIFPALFIVILGPAAIQAVNILLPAFETG